MRKYKGFIIGLIVGIVTAMSGTVFADGISMIGKKVDATYRVMINGDFLPINAISIEGTSYLPVRKFAETVNYAVYWNEDTKIISLTNLPEVPGVKLSINSTENKISEDPNITTIITGDGTYNVTIDPTKDRDTQTQNAMILILKNNELTKAQAELIRLQQSLDGAHQSYLGTGYPEERWPDTAIYKSYISDIADQQSKIAQLQAELAALQ